MKNIAGLALVLAALLASCAAGGDDGPTPSSVYPLKAGPTGRYLVDQSGKPFLLIGDAPQALIVNASPSEAESLLGTRAAQGFNAVWIMLLANEYCGGRANASTLDGLKPFTRDGDLSTPNSSYFTRAEQIIQAAADHGLAVLLDPIETGGWLETLRANGAAKCEQYGRYVGGRFKDFDNIVWEFGSDFQTWRDEADDALLKAVAAGIMATDTRHIRTLLLDFYTSASLDNPDWSNLVSLNAVYTYYPTYAEVLKGYNHVPPVPVFLAEADYELEHGADAERLRRQAYWSLLSGACGYVFGNGFVWPLMSGWQSHLESTGQRELGYCRSLLLSRSWQTLVPDQDHALVTAGFGTFSSGGTPHASISENNYVTAASTPDGRLGLVYVPSTRTITVDLTAMSGPVTARWYDPTTGSYQAIAGSPFSNASSHAFTTPGPHLDGAGDWVLVLEAQ